MSQLSQQNNGSFDSQTEFSSQDSPTVGRKQSRPVTNSSSQLATEPGKRSLRKAAPSPLQMSSNAASPPPSATPTRTTFVRVPGDHLSKSAVNGLPEQPRSPKERLDDLLASEKSFYTSEVSPVETSPPVTKPRYTRQVYDTNGTARSVSDPVQFSKASGSPPSSASVPMAATAPSHRVEMGRAPPRTSSIDSAISSISAGTHSHKSSQDIQPIPDIANLIQAAGSPEAVIHHLLKEKQSQASQNAQLWRLVDKQRAMILGLNKDLERALKDKERYRKKLKESLAQVSNPSPVDSNLGVSSDARTVEAPKVGHVGALVSAGLRDPEEILDEQLPSPIDVALAPYPITPPMNNAPETASVSKMIEANHKMPSPTQHAFQQYNPDVPAPGLESGRQERKGNDISREIPYNASVPPSRSLPSDPPRGPPPKAPPPKASSSLQAPLVMVKEASPIMDEGLRSFPPPPRKAPPAPLDLGKRNDASTHLRQISGTGEESDSDYDDILEVDEIPTFTERGRRKTREEDDKEREIAAMKEAELRSLSKKSVKESKSRPTTPKEKAVVRPLEPMPAAPRAFPIAPPDFRHLAPSESATGSLAGMLNASRALDAPNGLMSPPLMSPGLPASPRPVDRGMTSPRFPGSSSSSSLTSPLMSPRGMGAFPGAIPLSPRAPRQPIPLPPNTPMTIASPGISKGMPMQLLSPKPPIVSKNPGGTKTPQMAYPSSNDRTGIYRGLVTEDYPDLLLPPNALPSIDVRVASSRLKPSRASLMFPKNFDEDPVFTLAIFARSSGNELWRVEKDSTSLTQLDQSLKQSPLFTARIPDKSLFSGHAPAKVDARRTALDKYLDEVLNTQMDEESALDFCRYLSTNAMPPNAEDVSLNNDPVESSVKNGPGGRPLMSGYLTKRGKNFGGWKARFFVLDGPVFKYYESPGGPHLGAIKLQNAQIGKQQTEHSPSRGEVEDPDNQYRHAFLILEPKRKDSSSLVRHVLCAESDNERDEWVEALLQYVDYKDSEDDDQQSPKNGHDRTGSAGSSHANGGAKKKMYGVARSQTHSEVGDDLRGVSYETTKQGSIPHGVRSKDSGTPSPPTHGYERDPMSQISASHSMKSISAPTNAQPIQDAGAWGNRLAPGGQDDKIKQKKRSFFGFGTKVRVSAEGQDLGSNDSTSSLSQMAYDLHGPIRPVFGAPLGEAVRFNHPVDVNIELPAVVYRCIEYLDAKNAAGEEGIFRLSGSNVVIKQLRERFNTEGDVNLVTDDQYYDIHAVASLLKLYLRELPTTILTRELHLEFLAVTELHHVNEKVNALNGLVYRLPRANNLLLRYLSGFLINIINHADTNKMTVRNVGIVFSPTLNIPAPVFALFLQQYDDIFGQEPDLQDSTPVAVTVTAPPLTPDDIRSPRRQMFQELPTPSFNQQSFPQNRGPAFPIPQHYHQQQSAAAAYDTGFTPLQPTYENPQLPTMAGPEYGSLAQTLAGPSYDHFNEGSTAHVQYPSENQTQMGTKNKRRESSMFGMGIGLGQRKPSNNKLREESQLVTQESFFD